MSAADIAMERVDRKAYVRFETRPVENHAESVKQGRYVAKDVDFVLLTPPYSKDVIIFKVEQWFANMKQDVANGRLPEQWEKDYRKQYEAWKEGREIPLEGTPILGWSMISPAQQEMLVRMNVRTVEDAAGMNDDALRRFGMGGMDVKNKASAWLAQADKGKGAAKMAELEKMNSTLLADLETARQIVEQQDARIAALEAMMKAGGQKPEISASDLVPEDEPVTPELRKAYEQRFGKAPHHRMKAESIRQALAG